MMLRPYFIIVHFPDINCCIFTRATKKDFLWKTFQLVPSMKFILSTTACNPLFLARLVIPVLSLLSNILSSWGVHCSLPKEGSNTFRTETTSASKHKCGTKPNSETKFQISKVPLIQRVDNHYKYINCHPVDKC